MRRERLSASRPPPEPRALSSIRSVRGARFLAPSGQVCQLPSKERSGSAPQAERSARPSAGLAADRGRTAPGPSVREIAATPSARRPVVTITYVAPRPGPLGARRGQPSRTASSLSVDARAGAAPARRPRTHVGRPGQIAQRLLELGRSRSRTRSEPRRGPPRCAPRPGAAGSPRHSRWNGRAGAAPAPRETAGPPAPRRPRRGQRSRICAPPCTSMSKTATAPAGQRLLDRGPQRPVATVREPRPTRRRPRPRPARRSRSGRQEVVVDAVPLAPRGAAGWWPRPRSVHPE